MTSPVPTQPPPLPMAPPPKQLAPGAMPMAPGAMPMAGGTSTANQAAPQQLIRDPAPMQEYQQQRTNEMNSGGYGAGTMPQTGGVGTPTPGAPTAQPPAPTNMAQEDPGTAPPWLRQSSTQAWQGGPAITTANPDRSALPSVQTGAVNRSGLPQLQSGLDTSGFADFDQDFAAAGQRGADAAYAGATQFMDEDFAQDNAALESRLTNQGFARGTEAFNNEMGRQQRGQNAARQSAAFQAQGVGHAQSGDFLDRALRTRQQQSSEQGQNAGMGLAARGMLGSEGASDVDRAYAQSMGQRGLVGSEMGQDADRINAQSIAGGNLALGARGQDRGVEAAMHSSAGQQAAAGAAAASNRYNTDTQRDLALRGYGLQQDQQDFNNMATMIGLSRSGVNMPNFGAPGTLPVDSAYGIAGRNADRNAIDRSGLYGLGASVLGNVDYGAIARQFGYG